MICKYYWLFSDIKYRLFPGLLKERLIKVKFSVARTENGVVRVRRYAFVAQSKSANCYSMVGHLYGTQSFHPAVVFRRKMRPLLVLGCFARLA